MGKININRLEEYDDKYYQTFEKTKKSKKKRSRQSDQENEVKRK